MNETVWRKSQPRTLFFELENIPKKYNPTAKEKAREKALMDAYGEYKRVRAQITAQYKDSPELSDMLMEHVHQYNEKVKQLNIKYRKA